MNLGEILPVFFSSFGDVLAWPTFGYLLIGVFIGFWVGILPGLGGSAALALMLPFVFTMEPVQAIAFLLGMRAVTGTTSDLTSIIFGVPGDSAAAATVFDGYPMSRQGQVGRAIGAALSSSLLAGCFGAFVLALLIPVVQPLVLKFGPAEFFMLALLGLSFVVVLSSEAPLKGAIMACAGFLLATIGQHPGTGRLRFTFDSLYLWDGIDIVVATIGLFAVPALVAMLGTRDQVFLPPAAESVKDSWVTGFRDCARHWFLVIRCSMIGAFFGLIPGIGGSSSQFIAYGHAKTTSKTPETFGKGNVEGVLAAGSNNNSNDGAQLLPTIVFGIPGSGAMAIILAAFIVTGLVPGPSMLAENLDVTFAMVWTIVIANIIAVVVCLIVMKYLIRLMKTKASRIAPFIVIFVFIGAYTVASQWNDMVAMIVFGFAGIVAHRYGWPVPPLLLGLVLGFTAETNFFLASSLADGYSWLTRPIVVAIAIVILISVAGGPILRRAKQGLRRKAPTAEAALPANDVPMSDTDSDRWAFLVSAATLVFPIVFIQQTYALDLPSRAARFPLLVSWVMVVLATVQVIIVVRRMLHRRSHDRTRIPSGEPSRATASSMAVGGIDGHALGAPTTAVAVVSGHAAAGEPEPDLMLGLLLFLGFFAMLWLLGFLVTVPIYTFLLLRLFSKEKVWAAAAGAALASLGFYLLFVEGINVRFFDGALFTLLSG